MRYLDAAGSELPGLPPLRTFRVLRGKLSEEIVQAHTFNPGGRVTTFITAAYHKNQDSEGYCIVMIVKRAIWGITDLEEITDQVASGTGTMQ